MSTPARHGVFWNRAEEERILRLHAEGRSIHEIARAVEREPVAVEIRLERLGVKDYAGALQKFMGTKDRKIDQSITLRKRLEESICGLKIDKIVFDDILLKNSISVDVESFWKLPFDTKQNKPIDKRVLLL